MSYFIPFEKKKNSFLMYIQSDNLIIQFNYLFIYFSPFDLIKLTFIETKEEKKNDGIPVENKKGVVEQEKIEVLLENEKEATEKIKLVEEKELNEEKESQKPESENNSQSKMADLDNQSDVETQQEVENDSLNDERDIHNRVDEEMDVEINGELQNRTEKPKGC